MSQKPAKQSNKYSHLAEPQVTLDFHKAGILTSKEINDLTKRFLELCSKKGIKKVLIITGKGLHSQNGVAVIKPLVEKILSNNEYVKTFSWAAINRGGAGAFEVNLE